MRSGQRIAPGSRAMSEIEALLDEGVGVDSPMFA
jgi:hypothetical protein